MEIFIVTKSKLFVVREDIGLKIKKIFAKLNFSQTYLVSFF